MRKPKSTGYAASGLPSSVTGRSRSAGLIGCLAAILAVASPASAQEFQDSSDLARSVYANPADLDLGYQYAQALLGAEQYQQAAAQLERMLIIEPNQPRLRLELGVLYFRLGSYDLSQVYLGGALEDPGLTHAVRERVKYYLEEAARRSSPHRFSGSVSFGGRFQSNANGGVNQDLVSSASGPILLPPNLRQRPDVNAYVNGDVSYSYDLGLPREAAIVSTLGFFGTRQTSPDYYNFTGLMLQSGVRFAPLPETMPSLRLFVYVHGESALLNDGFYDAAIGPGLEISASPASRLTTSLTLEQRFVTYDAVSHAPEAGLLSGDESLAHARIAYRVDPALILFADGGVRSVGTRQTQFNFMEYQATAGVLVLYPAPFQTPASSSWNLRASIGHYWLQYGGPDPVISPGQTRSDRAWRFRLGNEIPVFRSWAVVQQLEYWTNHSNLPNYDRDNFIAAVGVTYKF